MILTGSKLQEIGKALYGDSWPSILGKRLKKSRKTIFRYREGAPMPSDLKRQLAQLVEDQIAELGQHHQKLTEDALEE